MSHENETKIVIITHCAEVVAAVVAVAVVPITVVVIEVCNTCKNKILRGKSNSHLTERLDHKSNGYT